MERKGNRIITHTVTDDQGGTELYWSRADDDHTSSFEGSFQFHEDGSATFLCRTDEDEPFVLHIMGNRIVVANSEDQPPSENAYIFDTATFEEGGKPPLESIEVIVAYSMADEERDYAERVQAGDIEPGDRNHIYTHLRRVSAWVDSQ